MPSFSSCFSYLPCWEYMNFLNTRSCIRLLGTFLSSGSGSAENFCFESAPALMSWS